MYFYFNIKKTFYEYLLKLFLIKKIYLNRTTNKLNLYKNKFSIVSNILLII